VKFIVSDIFLSYVLLYKLLKNVGNFFLRDTLFWTGIAVCDLLIDYGVPDRGHRKNILNPEFRKCAVVYIEEVDDGINFFFIQQFK
jgi:hypothetical protein